MTLKIHLRVALAAGGLVAAAIVTPASAQTTTALAAPAASSDEASRALAADLTRTSKCSGATVFSDLRARLGRGDVAAADAGRALAIVIKDETACPALRTAASALQEAYPASLAAPAPVANVAATPGPGAADPASMGANPQPVQEDIFTSPSDFVVGPPPRNLTREQRS